MIEDYIRRGIIEPVAYAMAYNEIKEIVAGARCNINLHDLLPPPEAEPMILDDIVIDISECRRAGEEMYETLNVKQKEIADAILNQEKQCVFIDGPGGSGKTYLYNTINNILMGQGKKVLNVAWSGIAATLLPNGRTVHSAFGLPVPVDDVNRTSNIVVQSEAAQRLREIDTVIWDEAPMAPRQAIDAVDMLLKDIMSNTEPFGGKRIILGGDFRQIPPVVPKASRTEVVRTTIKWSDAWKNFEHFTLTENMRAQEGGQNWCDYLLKIGNGEIGEEFEVPDDLLSKGNLIEEIFGDIQNVDDIGSVIDRAILTPKNYDSLEMNNKVLALLPGEERIYKSVDEAVCDDNSDRTLFPMEFLNTLTPQSYPPHELHLKKGAIVMLIRNLRINKGLCNGTRLIVKDMSKYSLGCEVATGCSKGEYVIIPRITFLPNKNDQSPFRLKRRQFPIRLSFAMTINKSQGQTFSRVGLYLPTPIFSHGQLYVACSRVKKREQLKILLPEGKKSIANVVYQEMLY